MYRLSPSGDDKTTFPSDQQQPGTPNNNATNQTSFGVSKGFMYSHLTRRSKYFWLSSTSLKRETHIKELTTTKKIQRPKSHPNKNNGDTKNN